MELVHAADDVRRKRNGKLLHDLMTYMHCDALSQTSNFGFNS